MIFNNPFSDDDVHRSAQVAATPFLYAQSTYAGIEALIYFQEEYLKPIFQTLIGKTDRELAFIGTYYRIVGYVLSIKQLNAQWHVQSIASASRSIFELYVDAELLARDSTSESTERFHAFTRVERFRVASQIVDFFNANQDLRQDDIEPQRDLVSNAGARSEIEALVDKHWGRNSRPGRLRWPSHWSTHQDLRSRAKALGSSFEAMYVRFVYQLHWHVHSGATGFAGIPRENYDTFVVKLTAWFWMPCLR